MCTHYYAHTYTLWYILLCTYVHTMCTHYYAHMYTLLCTYVHTIMHTCTRETLHLHCCVRDGLVCVYVCIFALYKKLNSCIFCYEHVCFPNISNVTWACTLNYTRVLRNYHTYITTHTHAHTESHTYTCVHTHKYTNARMHTYTQIHRRVHTNTLACTHTQMHTHRSTIVAIYIHYQSHNK